MWVWRVGLGFQRRRGRVEIWLLCKHKVSGDVMYLGYENYRQFLLWEMSNVVTVWARAIQNSMHICNERVTHSI